MGVIKQAFSGADNDTWDIGRILWAIGTLVFLGISWDAYVHRGQAFAPQDFGIGLGSLLSGGGAALWLKAKTEPKPHA